LLKIKTSEMDDQCSHIILSAKPVDSKDVPALSIEELSHHAANVRAWLNPNIYPFMPYPFNYVMVALLPTVICPISMAIVALLYQKRKSHKRILGMRRNASSKAAEARSSSQKELDSLVPPHPQLGLQDFQRTSDTISRACVL
jgi:hypothetical protein